MGSSIYISYLVDGYNFEASLRDAPAHILAYALALTSGVDGKGQQAAAIRGRLNELDQGLEEVGAIL